VKDVAYEMLFCYCGLSSSPNCRTVHQRGLDCAQLEIVLDSTPSCGDVNVMDTAPMTCLLLLTCLLKLTIHCLNDYLVMNLMCFGRYYRLSQAMVTTCAVVTITDN